MGIIYYNQKSSKDYGIVVEKPPGHITPERDYDIYHIPGKNGNVVIDKGSYRNVNKTYDIAFGSLHRTFAEMASSVAAWLHSASGYARLEDTYDPDHFRLASYHEDTDMENILAHAGRVSITFDCKPQRYLKTGEVWTEYNGNGSIENPTDFISQPLLQIQRTGSGSGRIVIGEYTIELLETNANNLYLDSELQDAFYGAMNYNPYVVLAYGFPVLKPGENSILLEGNVTQIRIMPRWWIL